MEKKAEEEAKIKYDLVQPWLDKCSELSLDDCDTESIVSSSVAEEELAAHGIRIATLEQNLGDDFSELQNLKTSTFSNSQNIHIGKNIFLTGSVYIQNNEAVFKPQSTSSDGFIKESPKGLVSSVKRLVPRMLWLAQPAIKELDPLPKPAPIVIICHTATEAGTTQAENILLVRTIQQFHIESRKFDDISYNFLIGGEGNIYEGRGFNKAGAHTYGYNHNSIAISFVGTFMKTMPPKICLDLCQQLIEHGVNEGHIAQNYKLLGHCQCTTTESPGSMLFDEIKTWPHWCQD